MACKPTDSCDRFSDLPHPIIHTIFSYLGTNDIPRMSGLSTRFRQLCLTSPYLDLKATFGYCHSDCESFSSFVDRVLSQRNGVGIYRLRLHWVCESPHYSERAGSLHDKWIKLAVECNVQELEIGIFPGMHKFFTIPPTLCTYQLLRELMLNLEGGKLVLQPASFISLVALTLSNVKLCYTFSGGTIGEWVSNCCSSLERLCLENVKGIIDLNICSSSLQQLRMVGCTFFQSTSVCITSGSLKQCTMSGSEFKKGVSIKVSAERLQTFSMEDVCFRANSRFCIFAPNLLAFRWTGDPVKVYKCLEHFLFLENAAFRFQVQRHLVLEHPEGNWVIINDFEREFFPDQFVEDSSSVALLHSVRSTPFLKSNIEVFATCHQPSFFDNLQHLIVTVPRIGADEDRTLSPFLIGLLKLRTLTLRQDSSNVDSSEVVFLMCLRVQNYATGRGKPQKLVFCLQDSEESESIDLKGEENEGLLQQIGKYDKVSGKAVSFTCLRTENYVADHAEPRKTVFYLQDGELVMEIRRTDKQGLLIPKVKCEKPLEEVIFFY